MNLILNALVHLPLLIVAALATFVCLSLRSKWTSLFTFTYLSVIVTALFVVVGAILSYFVAEFAGELLTSHATLPIVYTVIGSGIGAWRRVKADANNNRPL